MTNTTRENSLPRQFYKIIITARTINFCTQKLCCFIVQTKRVKQNKISPSPLPYICRHIGNCAVYPVLAQFTGSAFVPWPVRKERIQLWRSESVYEWWTVCIRKRRSCGCLVVSSASENNVRESVALSSALDEPSTWPTLMISRFDELNTWPKLIVTRTFSVFSLSLRA